LLAIGVGHDDPARAGLGGALGAGMEGGPVAVDQGLVGGQGLGDRDADGCLPIDGAGQGPGGGHQLLIELPARVAIGSGQQEAHRQQGWHQQADGQEDEPAAHRADAATTAEVFPIVPFHAAAVSRDQDVASPSRLV
jgi:hypothetical protein